MGISVFANAIDVLKGIDLIYDSYQNEFRLGKKNYRAYGYGANYEHSRRHYADFFDDNDTEFYAIKETDDFTQLKEINMEIRSEAHLGALKNSLDVLSSLTGLGSDRFSFETYKNGIKTATEVISEKSELFQNLKKHELILSAALKKLYRAVLCLSGKDADERNIKIDFDDSIIQDKEKEFAQDLQLVSSGIMQKWEFRVKHFNESEREAKKMCAEDEFAEE
ncbi:MAG: phage portal protein [Clostridiales bacterium]|nr:MAG: phage portal protein [Clostridiales bacterium]